MKTQITLIAFLLSIATFLSAQNVPNGGFEEWTDGEPNEWSTSNFLAFSTIIQSDVSHSGNFAIRGFSLEYNNNNIIPEIECDGGGTGVGFPVNEDYTFLKFWLKFDDDNNDHLEAYVSMRDADSLNIATASIDIEEPYETWHQVIIPIDYSGEGAAFCAIQILMTGGLGEPSLDSWFVIDDMELLMGVGIAEELKGIPVAIYPNPVTNIMNIEADMNLDRVSILNTLGQEVYREEVNISSTQIDLSNYQEGIYFVRIEANSETYTKKIMVK